MVYVIQPRPEIMNKKSTSSGRGSPEATNKESSKATEQKTILIEDSPETFVAHRGGTIIG